MQLSACYFCSTQSGTMLPALQNGVLKQKIDGANTPALSQYIVQFTPVSADTDDLAVSVQAAHQLESLCASSKCCPKPLTRTGGPCRTTLSTSKELPG